MRCYRRLGHVFAITIAVYEVSLLQLPIDLFVCVFFCLAMLPFAQPRCRCCRFPFISPYGFVWAGYSSVLRPHGLLSGLLRCGCPLMCLCVHFSACPWCLSLNRAACAAGFCLRRVFASSVLHGHVLAKSTPAHQVASLLLQTPRLCARCVDRRLLTSFIDLWRVIGCVFSTSGCKKR